MRDPFLGATVGGRYRVDSLIGEGGLCAVYRAEDVREKRRVAVKVLPAARAAAPELAGRFRREVTTGKRIEHSNVVAISDSGELEDGSLYLVMELLEGRSLAALLAGGRVTLARALAIARQMLVGLAEAHRLGIAHRDVKPENVILVDVGGVETVKLLDFGIASNDRAAVKLTAAGVAFGTPEYISPEMAMGLPADARADLYAVGVVLFQMVTGRLPFTSKDPAALLRAHAQEPAPSPREVTPDGAIPPELDALILRALQKLPEDRYASANDMIAALDQLPRVKRGGFGRAIFVLIALALVAAAVWWWWNLRQNGGQSETQSGAQSEPQSPAPKPAKKRPTLPRR
ncbi:MAG TPA: serine/threonine-protein kinase [Polyangia bacterium]|nr:serine/threonine-protein kinase [Polyangia bacterium]